MTEPATNNYKDTLNLPKTNFDMKANLTQREPLMVEKWQTENLYQKIRSRPHPKGKWILHDGPPYANGDIHMGHLLNKVLKDITIKFRTMQGHDSPYVPGWDCHGLPIESAIQKELGPKFRELTKEEVRKKCHDYAMKYVKLQGDSFQRLGILGEFEHPYLTLDNRYESGILDVLAELVERDLVYRQKKPVHWCTNDRTALAEAELEYQNKKDTSIFVRFQIADGFNLESEKTSVTKLIEEKIPDVLEIISPESLRARVSSLLDPAKIAQDFLGNASLIIWTTTPWTLPANRAVAINPKALYALVVYHEGQKRQFAFIAQELVDRVMKVGGYATYEVRSIRTGKALVEDGLSYLHPLDPSRVQPVVLADYVTLEDGTGLVHTAPGHGKEDYQTGIKCGLEIYNPVLPDGKYDDTVPEFLKGKSIWDANQLVIDKLKENGTLFHAQVFDHEYPHCWRCKKPVIFRATEQWFVKAAGAPDGNPGLSAASPLWSTAKKFVNAVQFIPTWGKNRLDGMLDTRPDWCISRQRSWGVPIPAFFDQKGNLLLTTKSVRHIAAYFKQHGADSWYTHTPEQLLGAETWTDTVIDPHGKIISEFIIQTSGLTKGSDILDVWFESGASHHAVLECTHPELGYPADMYLEGSDQHRGWFQSSLLEAAGYKSEPPFKQVLTHGFIVDEKGRKMSKSEGNDIKVNDALKQYGADVLRLWVSSVDYQNDIACGPNLLKNMGEAYRKIRNTIRYLLGNLYDFNPNIDSVSPHLNSIDQWMQSKLNAWSVAVHTAYDMYEFHNVFKLVYEFCNVEISSIYAKAIKDRLYCELPNSPKRRASQTVCFNALTRLIELSAPILVFTAEEAWSAARQLPGCDKFEPSIHLHVINESGASQESERIGNRIDNALQDISQNMEKVAQSPYGKVAQNKFKELLNSFQEINKTPEIIDTFSNAHWAILMPLVEKGNKQLDELKRTVGLGNPLDAEAVIIVPKIDDEMIKFIAAYGPEIEDALGVGFHRIEHGEIWDIKINDTRNIYPSCARSWKRRPDVGSNPAYPDLSARDASVVAALRGK